MKNFVNEGENVTLTAPYAVLSGGGLLVGSLFGVAAFDAANGAQVEAKTEGVFDLTALSTDVATQGAKAYWDNTNKRVTVTAASNTLIGAFTVAKANGDATGRIYVDGVIR
jgi:predicted RecA/RadA family phage recombinase